jgi:hypothetical protein
MSDDPLRGTGRTTRMLDHAKRLEMEGLAVYVIAANPTEVMRLRGLLPTQTSIKVETPDSCRYLDWQTLMLRGTHSNCRVLVDHFAIESRFGHLFRMMHAYDL